MLAVNTVRSVFDEPEAQLEVWSLNANIRGCDRRGVVGAEPDF